MNFDLFYVDKSIPVKEMLHDETGDRSEEPSPDFHPLSIITTGCSAARPLLEDSPDGENGTIVCIRYDNTCSGGRCVHDLAVASIDTHMS